MVNGLLKNRESPPPEAQLAAKSESEAPGVMQWGPALCTREGEEGRLPPSGCFSLLQLQKASPREGPRGKTGQ